MEDLLFLSHRIPYPPDKGDKVRSWNILRHLTQRFRVHLGCFHDDPADAQHIPYLESLCASVLCLPLTRPQGLLRGALSLARGASLSEGYFRHPRLVNWVARTIAARDIRNLFVFCSAMAPYAMPYLADRRSAIDLVDVDSEKWKGYADIARWPLSAFYRNEHRAVLRLERRAATAFQHAFFISAQEQNLFQSRAGTLPGVGHFGNGVDLDYFDPAIGFPNPFQAGVLPLVMVGRMDYPPNDQAARWFASDILPILRRKHANLQFWAVGAGPGPALKSLADRGEIHITGRIADVRPYLAHAACTVAPLLLARGVQNKVLEAMAMGKPVVATGVAREGLDVEENRDLLCADGAQAFADAVEKVIGGSAPEMGRLARQRVESVYTWTRQIAPLDAALGAPLESP